MPTEILKGKPTLDQASRHGTQRHRVGGCEALETRRHAGVTAERETLSASLQAHKPLVREMFTEQDLDDLRHNFAGALVELFFGEVGDGMRHR